MSTRSHLRSKVDAPDSVSRHFQLLKSRNKLTGWWRQRSKLPLQITTHVVTYETAFSVQLTPDGKQALLKLSKGDMRRALNILQACHAAYDVTGETEIYNCTGNPHPEDIESIVNSMLSDEFTTSYQSRFPDLRLSFFCADSIIRVK